MAVFLILRLNYKRDLSLKEIQTGQSNLADKYAVEYEDYTVYYDAPHIAMAFHKDRFDSRKSRYTPQVLSGEPIPEKSIVIWDSWFSKTDYNVPLEALKNSPKLKLVDCEKTGNPKKPKQSCLFEVRPEYTNKKVLMLEDFENESSDKYLDQTVATSGKYSRWVGREKPYSKSFTGWINAFAYEENPIITATCWVYLPKGITPEKLSLIHI